MADYPKSIQGRAALSKGPEAQSKAWLSATDTLGMGRGCRKLAQRQNALCHRSWAFNSLGDLGVSRASHTEEIQTLYKLCMNHMNVFLKRK